MAFIDTKERQQECLRAQGHGEISSAVASTLDGLLTLAARGELAYFTKEGLKPMGDYERENCAIAQAAVSQHFVVKILTYDQMKSCIAESSANEAFMESVDLLNAEHDNELYRWTDQRQSSPMGIFEGFDEEDEAAAKEDLKTLWSNVYRAFMGAFDTPIARRRQNDEFSEDARRLIQEFNERISNDKE